ncbi:MAG TPA: glycosyltransferase [Roseiflexaceae bacterium]|nr:glycosyltransferase [Roseiflexaceae bacterium]
MIAPAHVGYLLRSFPRLSQTFVLNEILALERLGLHIHIFAVTNPREPIVHAQVADVRAPVAYLEVAQRRRKRTILAEHARLALASPHRYFSTLRYVMRHPEFDEGYTAASRYDCFVQAVYLVELLERERRQSGVVIRHLHAHFAHDPALIALLAHMLTGISYSFTTHARDLYQTHAGALIERIASASMVLTVCEPNVEYLHRITPALAPAKVRLVYNGVDLERFRPAPRGAGRPGPPLILSISRLVEKKGFADLLAACQQLKGAGYRFQLVIYGDGPLRATLAGQIAALGLGDVVRLAGACTQQELLPALQSADIFALTPHVTETGDRDGIPTVLLEAMACGLPVVSTAVAGIPELVRHDHNGLLAAPRDVPAIAASLAALLNDEALRARLGAAARQTAVDNFDLHARARQIAALFDGVLRGEPVAGSMAASAIEG